MHVDATRQPYSAQHCHDILILHKVVQYIHVHILLKERSTPEARYAQNSISQDFSSKEFRGTQTTGRTVIVSSYGLAEIRVGNEAPKLSPMY
jgi:hypothetical protein